MERFVKRLQNWLDENRQSDSTIRKPFRFNDDAVWAAKVILQVLFGYPVRPVRPVRPIFLIFSIFSAYQFLVIYLVHRVFLIYWVLVIYLADWLHRTLLIFWVYRAIWVWMSLWVFWASLILLGSLYYLGYFAVDYHSSDNSCWGPDIDHNMRTITGALLAELFILLNITNHHRSVLINISSTLTGKGDKKKEILSRCENVIKSTKNYGQRALASGVFLIFVYLFSENLDPETIEGSNLNKRFGSCATINIKYVLFWMLGMIFVLLTMPAARNNKETSAICQCFIAEKLSKI